MALAATSLGIAGEQSITMASPTLTVASENPDVIEPSVTDDAKLTPMQRAFDVTLTLLLMPVIVAIGAAIALAIYIDSPGPVMFRSWRVGKNGVPFTMLKFRKMRADAGHKPLTTADDERFTPIGRFLAATRLDELPQVWNVLRGEMRLVGPRPEVEYFVAQFPEEYGEILSVTPGITGVAQLKFVDEKALLVGADPAHAYREHVLPEKIEIDLRYVRGRSLGGDLMILARTVVLPLTLVARKLRSRSDSLRIWLPTAVAAVVLVVMFVVTSSHLS
jgi:lipopolysaccharide/colanic/teichoic acid biosynthesis glycosyltransferase